MTKEQMAKIKEIKARRHGISNPQQRNADIDHLLGEVSTMDAIIFAAEKTMTDQFNEVVTLTEELEKLKPKKDPDPKTDKKDKPSAKDKKKGKKK